MGNADARVPVLNYTQVPNIVFDLMPSMSSSELRIVLAIVRQTFGWHKASDQVSLTQLMRLTGLSRQGVINGLKEAMARGIVTRVPIAENGQDTFAYHLVFEPGVVNDVDGGRSTSLTGGSQRSRPGVVNDVDSQKKGKKPKETTTNGRDTSAVRNGGGGESTKTETQNYLEREGISATVARIAKDYDLADTQALVGSIRADGGKNGAIATRLKAGPPTPAAAPDERPPSDMPILTARIDGTARAEWLARFRSAASPQAKRQVLNDFCKQQGVPA